jgi:hypothetical protein
MSGNRDVKVTPQGPRLPGGAPSEVRVEIVLRWDEVREIVRTGAVGEPIVDDLMVELLGTFT